ncbi:acetylornithine transaminase [Actinomyces bowdenii]|uniref:Acetylornithine aminotransferase n=1 Tax=Actinomyces bowdenii TaxID=131109 RepID=A0A853EIY8_9ACTO|nr:acetylornithine transaminase [Actinomyces bowdenii]MBF0697056.1 acetylornithine transaminase [Actinomyces bowdenii]NYS69229.1 acetylornithine transaminase [Actinomyces bowdenii]
MSATGEHTAGEHAADQRTSGEQWSQRYAQAVMNTFGPPQRVLVRGRGTRVWDADGREYLDLLAGIAVNCLGHAHPAILQAVTDQLATLGHVSNFFTTPAQVRLAERLAAIVFPEEQTGHGDGAQAGPAGSTGGAGSADGVEGTAGAGGRVRVFLANSGTEANEAAFKIARRHGGSRRPRILALERAFHGRTMGALALTHKAAYREPFEPLPGGVEFLPAGDAQALERAMGPDVAALVIEPIQGEAGVRELGEDYLRAARELTRSAGALLICDEVQTGMGRTGAWMAHHLLAPGVVPDVVTLAKGLGGGIPIGALVARGQAAELLGPGQHGTTFGGNPVASAAALAVIETIGELGLLDHARRLGEQWAQELAQLPQVAQVRGRGLLLGVGLAAGAPPAPQVASALLERGFIVNAPGPDTIRLAPPLILTPQEASSLTGALAQALAERSNP